MRYAVITLLLLLAAAVMLVNYTPVQNWLAGRAAKILSERLKTRVTVAHVRIDFLNHFLLQGVYMEDQSHDTLLYAGEAQVRISDWFIFKDKPTLHYLGLQDAYVRLYRPEHSNVWNYAFVEDAFGTPDKKDTAGKPFKFDLQKVMLNNVRFRMDDHWGGEDIDLNIGNVALNARSLDFDKKLLDVADFTAGNTDVIVREYKAGHPPRTGHIPTWGEGDQTPFNPDMWAVKVSKVNLEGCMFHLTMNDRIPQPDVFDENHLAITNINISVHDASITGDTVSGTVDNLTAHERCGLVIKKMHSRITVSPIASVCENLYLETNYSKVQDYYAMHYRHFPDFTEYIDSVVMVAHVKNATVDERDIAYFAPELRQLPQVVLYVTGDGKGTVSDISGHNITITDGVNALKGNATLKGLPDIYKTYITCSDLELFTNGKGIVRYAPGLEKSPHFAPGLILYAFFKGKYEGYVDNFRVEGSLNTNLGSISGDIKLNMPQFDPYKAVFSGSVAADKVQIRALLRQSLFGSVSLKEDFSGTSFDPGNGQLKIDGNVSEIGINDYPYHNITTHGLLAKKQFTGSVMVDDPNLALEFDGGINYNNGNVAINATAHLLTCNFSALKLAKDSITLTGDFDLKCSGNNLDNTFGYARLNNISLKRNAHRVAIDSILVRSSGDSVNKQLTIQSNNILAAIKGSFQLSTLPASFQYYLSRYIPNYIKEPEKFAANQNFSFSVSTTSVDSMLAASFSFLRGFDSSSFTGSLNTAAKKLTLNAAVPYATIGNFHLSDVAISGIGDFDMLGVTASVDNISVGDSFLNSSLSLTTTVSHDSVGFTIATTAPDTSSAITLNGQIVARKDSLYFTILPSQFYLNQVKWDIAGGSKVVYSNNYLLVQDVALTSGLQKITAATQLENNDKSLLINTENLDLGQFGSWAGFAAYQPDGHVNGVIKIDKIFQDVHINANIKATDVLLGADTVGTINLIGDYDGAKKVISLDPQTGIYRGGASLTASGNISFDSAVHQKLDGSIQLNNAPVVWVSPFLQGIMSRLAGTVNGKIDFSGTSYSPEMNGDLTLTDGAFHLDYMGCNYTIPSAHVQVDNHRIELGKVLIYDSKNRVATLTGHFSHNLFRDMRMDIKVSSDKIEAMNLTVNDNSVFYGNVVAAMNLTLAGPFNDLRLHIYNARAADKSQIFIPESSGSDAGAYSFVSFKTHGKAQDKVKKKTKDKFYVNIDAEVTPEVEMIIVLDPASGDQIRAKGHGHILLDIPPDNDVSTSGVFTVESGTYNFSLTQLAIHRAFNIQEGSTISFNGPFSETRLAADAVFRAKAKLSDLLTDAELHAMSSTDQTDAETPQMVDVIMHMNGPLDKPTLTFDVDLEDKHSQNTLAYQKLRMINNDPTQQFTQVGALLLIGQFIQSEGAGSGTAISGAVNNIGQVISSSASTGLTAIVNKITHDKAAFNVTVNYTNYNYTDASLGGINRNQVKLDVNKSYFNNRLQVELGSTSDWGHATSTSPTSNFNLTGDFRVQYQIIQSSGLRLNAFRTSDYDVTLNQDIVRSGVGMSWRKSFDNLDEFFHGRKYYKLQEQKKKQAAAADTTGNKNAPDEE